MLYRLRGVALVLAVLTAACGDDVPTAPTITSRTTVAPALLSCPPAVERQSVDALPVKISWDLPTVASVSVDKGECLPVSGSVFPIGTSTVTCTPDQTTLASSCSFAVTITPPDPVLRFTKFMAFGDSITEGFISPGLLSPAVTPREIAALLRAPVGRTIPGIFNAVAPLSAYPVQLQNLLTSAYPTQLIAVANKGVGGEETAEGVSRLTSSLLSVQPEVLLLFEGFNDISLSFVRRSPDDTTPISIAQTATNLESMVLNAQGRGVEVLLATLTPITAVYEDDVPGSRATVIALSAEIRSIATALGLGGIVDLYGALDGVPGLIGADGFHPTAAGYRRIAEVFFAEIVSRYDITPRAPSLTTP